MLGVRRSGVTVAIRALEQSGLIQNSHRLMTILDSEGLEANSCECYRVLKDELARLLG
jgi:Crp-like helix-turn-helix domain